MQLRQSWIPVAPMNLTNKSYWIPPGFKYADGRREPKRKLAGKLRNVFKNQLVKQSKFFANAILEGVLGESSEPGVELLPGARLTGVDYVNNISLLSFSAKDQQLMLNKELVNRLQNASCTIQCATVPAEAPLKKSSSTGREPSEKPVLDYLISAKSTWKNDPPRLVILGKPYTGKTTLSKILCQAWGCRYVNASELISRHLKERSGRGMEILKLLQQGEDLSEFLVFSIVTEELQSLEYRGKGYILDGLPNCSETLLQVPTQLEFLAQIYPEPFFWIYIDMSDADLKARWKGVHTDHATGRLHSQVSCDTQVEPTGRCDFPLVNEHTNSRLLMRHEEMAENLESNLAFYNQYMAERLAEFLERCTPSTVLYLDGTLCADELAKSLIEKIQAAIKHCGLVPSTFRNKAEFTHRDWESVSNFEDVGGGHGQCLIRFPKRSTQETAPESGESDQRVATCIASAASKMQEVGSPTETDCCCQCGAKLTESCEDLWCDRPPRLLLVGKPCTGKTALAKLLCATWNCELVNATELIIHHMTLNDEYGQRVKQLMLDGKDLDDALVISIMEHKLKSRECVTNGFVIDDFPKYSEKTLSVHKQLEFLESLNPGPEYVIDLQMPDEVLRSRWEAVKMDLRSGILYVDRTSQSTYGRGKPALSCCKLTCCVSDTSGSGQSQLITRHEELVESMDANITFYHEVVEPLLQSWIDMHFADKVIVMDGDPPTSEVLQNLRRKLNAINNNPGCPPWQLFTDKENLFSPGACCRRCGTRYTNLEPPVDLWADQPPRFIIFGKPCSGKTTLAKRLCNVWNCQLVNATELIQHHLTLNTVVGQKIRAILNSGRDLPDRFVINMLKEKLSSPACTECGYILDGIPTHSEMSWSIGDQLEFVENLHPRPDYVVDIRISDTDLRKRWEAIRIDVADGTLYTSRLNGHKTVHPSKPYGRIVRHPDFPHIDEEIKKRLITRHEELPENLDKHFPFYRLHVEPRVQHFINAHDPSKIIVLDGEVSPTKLLNTLLYKLNVMFLKPNVPTSELFPDDELKAATDSVVTPCGCQKHAWSGLEPMEELWLEKPPRVVIFGKPCVGKTTLAKRLCALWGCLLINASEMIPAEMRADTEVAGRIRAMLNSGLDLPDHLILDLIRTTISSPTCVERGYVLDGLPTHSELNMSIEDQLEMLRSLENGPEYIIHIQISDEDLRERWEAIRIDITDGTLYTKFSYDRTGRSPLETKPSVKHGRKTRHPDFPIVDEATKIRLITRHEELPENLDLHFGFYHRRLSGPLDHYISRHDPAAVVRVNGNVSPSELLQAVLLRMSIMMRHPGVPTSHLFSNCSEDADGSEDSKCQCLCGDKQDLSILTKGMWKNSVPRVLIIGNSCSGKTTLAKRLCKDWNSVLVNATELISHHLNSKTPLGDQMRQIMRSGHDLSDALVLKMVQDKLNSLECLQGGYVLDDFPTSSEKSMGFGQQLAVLLSSPVKPEYIVDIQVPEKDLKQRWEQIRIDLADGTLYPKEKVAGFSGAVQMHPAFPTPNENIRQRLITRHEELLENIINQSQFYNTNVRPHIDEFLKQYDSHHIIVVDGRKPTSEMCKTTYNAIRQCFPKAVAI
ncbi:adenylate/nucleoside-diphosphate kinase [Paragonimus westermani]|uniref:Adenylate/nucleoside-diphosphate kinase n=1 Tax=Paragonimus westermani TaxID=34504 RepID=A0A5J4NBY8_9TREM|nr:adenylate/nucleoside-diphosphate kinase [Paragonimus westermani]